MDLQELRKWAAEMERSATVLMQESGGDAQMMQSAFGSSRVALLLSDSARELESLRAQLAAVTAQRDGLLVAAKAVQELLGDDLDAPRIVDFRQACVRDLWDAFVEAIARAQPQQPQQPQEDTKP